MKESIQFDPWHGRQWEGNLAKISLIKIVYLTQLRQMSHVNHPERSVDKATNRVLMLIKG